MTLLEEPVVRIRCAPGDVARAEAALEKWGLAAERSPTGLLVRDADPDAVNEALAAGGAVSRVVVRERIGKLVGWLIDREGRLDGRGVNVRALVSRVLEEGGLAGRYAPKPEGALLAAALASYGELMATGAARVSWASFVERFCDARVPPQP